MREFLKSLSFFLLLFISGPVFAEDTESPDPPAEGSTLDLEATAVDSILVIGEAAEVDLPPVVGSVDIIGRDLLEAEHVDDTYELFNRVSGVYLARYNQGVINTDVAIRGFAGDGVTPHARLLIDGVPANLHNGYGELDQLFPSGMGSLAIVKGTSDATLGLHSVAGAYRVETRKETGVRELTFALGSFQAREAQAYLGFSSGSLTQSYALGYREAEGYRDNTDLNKYSAAGRWSFGLSDNSTLTAIARTSGYDADAPGYLSRDVARATPRVSAPFASEDGGDKTVDHLSLHFDKVIGGNTTWTARAFGQAFERERWVRFSEAGSLQNRFDDQDQFGGRTDVSWSLGEYRLDFGLDYEDQDVVEQRFGTIGQSRQRDTTRVLRDRRYNFQALGGYVSLRSNDRARWSWNIGLRADRLSGDFVQFGADGSASPRDMYDFGTIMQPKLNLLFAASEDWILFLNAGRTYQHPFGASAYTAGDRDARDVSVNDGFEAGARWQPGSGVDLRISAWRQDASDEFVVLDGDGQNVGETERLGLDLGLNWRMGSRTSGWLNYSRIETEIVRAGDSQVGFAGNELRGIPSFTASLGVSSQLNDDWSLGAHVDAQGDAFVNEANAGDRFGDFVLMHANVHYNTKWGTFGLDLNNLFDEYYEYVFDFGQTGLGTIHSPGDGRSFTVSWRLGR